MAWWIWVLLGFGLFACELITPGAFFFMFFGVGAIAVGILVWLDVVGPVELQWLLFSLISLVCLVPLRSRLVRWIGAARRSCAAPRGTHTTPTRQRCTRGSVARSQRSTA
jgi:membrane protein implicated in regulation of membrane protease activity